MITKSPPNINYLWANLMIEELIRNGVDTFCISPGSRSSALTMAVANNSKAKSLIHYDERGSAFRALGITSATQKPCAIITTSGTAAANVFPAVILEPFEQTRGIEKAIAPQFLEMFCIEGQ